MLNQRRTSLGNLPCVMARGTHSPGLGQAVESVRADVSWKGSVPAGMPLQKRPQQGLGNSHLRDTKGPRPGDGAFVELSNQIFQIHPCWLRLMFVLLSLGSAGCAAQLRGAAWHPEPLPHFRLRFQGMDGRWDSLTDDGAERCSPCLSYGSSTIRPIKHASRS